MQTASSRMKGNLVTAKGDHTHSKIGSHDSCGYLTSASPFRREICRSERQHDWQIEGQQPKSEHTYSGYLASVPPFRAECEYKSLQKDRGEQLTQHV